MVNPVVNRRPWPAALNGSTATDGPFPFRTAGLAIRATEPAQYASFPGSPMITTSRSTG